MWRGVFLVCAVLACGCNLLEDQTGEDLIEIEDNGSSRSLPIRASLSPYQEDRLVIQGFDEQIGLYLTLTLVLGDSLTLDRQATRLWSGYDGLCRPVPGYKLAHGVDHVLHVAVSVVPIDHGRDV